MLSCPSLTFWTFSQISVVSYRKEHTMTIEPSQWRIRGLMFSFLPYFLLQAPYLNSSTALSTHAVCGPLGLHNLFWPCFWQSQFLPLLTQGHCGFTFCDSYFVCFLIELHSFNILFYHARLIVLMLNSVSQMAIHPIQFSVIADLKNKFSIPSLKF